jgi:hypothetical protein
MPEVRLAWRAAVCHGSPRGQVVIGVAPLSELGALGAVFPPPVLRAYPGPVLTDSTGRARPCACYASDRDTLVLVPLADGTVGQDWNSLMTFAVRGEDVLRRFSAALCETEADTESPFVAALGFAPELERAFFASLARAHPGDLPDLRRAAARCAESGTAG